MWGMVSPLYGNKARQEEKDTQERETNDNPRRRREYMQKTKGRGRRKRKHCVVQSIVQSFRDAEAGSTWAAAEGTTAA